MTHLEQKIYHELYYNTDGGNLLEPSKVGEMARIAASIALELAEKAYHVGRLNMGREGDTTFKQFIQDYIGD